MKFCGHGPLTDHIVHKIGLDCHRLLAETLFREWAIQWDGYQTPGGWIPDLSGPISPVIRGIKVRFWVGWFLFSFFLIVREVGGS